MSTQDPKSSVRRAPSPLTRALMAGQEQQSEEALRAASRDKYAADWTRVGDLVEVPLRLIGPVPIIESVPRQAYIYVPVGCLTCGYTMFFHSGILDQRAEEAEGEE